MRLAIVGLLFSLSVNASSADVEQITLLDGRQLIGIYDEKAGVVNLSGPVSAVIRVKASQIKSREPYVPKAEDIAKPKPEPTPAEKEAPQSTLETARMQAKKLRQEAARIEFSAVVRWLQKETEIGVERPTLKDDPKKSEEEAHYKEMSRYKRHLRMKELLKESKMAETEEEHMQIVYRVNEIINKNELKSR